MRCAYFKSTRHGGGVFCNNALHEMSKWFYNGIIASSLEREKALQTQLGQAISDANKNKKQVSSKASHVAERIKQWVATRIRYEWRDVEMLDDSDLPEDVFWFCLCKKINLFNFSRNPRHIAMFLHLAMR